MPSDDQRRRVLDPVMRLLNADRDADAARKLVEALSHDHAFPIQNRLALLTKLIGKSSVMRLVRAFAAYSCVGCKGGLEPCGACGGRGRYESDRICDVCIGLGAVNCGFCAGSGLITYNFVPAGLRSPVMLERSRTVIKHAASLLDKPLPRADRGDPSAAAKDLCRQVLAINRLLDALNNSIEEALTAADSPAEERLRVRCRAACLNCAARLMRRLRESLRVLAEVASRQASSASNASARRSAALRADLYQKLADAPSFRGTNLHHLHVESALERKAAGRSALRRA